MFGIRGCNFYCFSGVSKSPQCKKQKKIENLRTFAFLTEDPQKFSVNVCCKYWEKIQRTSVSDYNTTYNTTLTYLLLPGDS